MPAALDVTLRIVGDGDAADRVRAAASDDPRIDWVGHVAPATSASTSTPPGRAGALVVGRAVRPVAAEAFAHGRPDHHRAGRVGGDRRRRDRLGHGHLARRARGAIVEAARPTTPCASVATPGAAATPSGSVQATTEALRHIYREACGDPRTRRRSA